MKKGGDNGVIKKIADLVHEKVLTEISDLADHSDRTGMRIQIELKRDAIPQVALNKLFKHTALQSTFGYNAVALVDGVPRTLSLLELRHALPRLPARDRHAPLAARAAPGREARARPPGLPDRARQPRRRDRADPRRRRHRGGAHAADGAVRAQRDPGLGDPRAAARAASPASRARRSRTSTPTSRSGSASCARCSRDEAKIDALIREELLELKEIYGRSDDRRTEIVAAEEELELEDMIAEEDMVIAITRSGYIKRLPVTAYREQRRGGIGVMGMDLKDDDYIEHLFVASTHDYVLFFTSVGKVYRLKVHELPLGSRQSKGRAIVNLLPFRQDEQVRAVIQTRNFEEAEYLLCATKNGVVKKTKLAEYNTPLKADGIIAIKMREGDELVARAALLRPTTTSCSSRARARRSASPRATRARWAAATEGVRGMTLRGERRGDRGRDRARRLRPARRDRERLRQAHARLRVPAQGPRRHGREDDPADRGARPARRRARRARRLPGDADLDRRHRDQDAGRGREAARPLDAGRDRDAPARGRDRLVARAGGRRPTTSDDARGRSGGRGDADGELDADARRPARRRRVRERLFAERLPVREVRAL